MADTPRAELAEEAFREGNLVALGVSPTAPEIAESRKLLDRVIGSLIGTEIGEKFVGLPQPMHSPSVRAYSPHLADPQNPPTNTRIIMGQTDPFTMTWDSTPDDGARMAVSAVSGDVSVTIDANGHLIDSGDRTTLQGDVTLNMLRGESYEWFYRADLAMWVLVTTNAAGALPTLDTCPLPVELDGLLLTATTMRLQARFGIDPRVGTIEEYRRILRIAKARYTQTVAKITNPDVPLNHDTADYIGGYLG